METPLTPFDLDIALRRAGPTWCDHPKLQLSDGGSFQPRAAIKRDNSTIAIICTVARHEIDGGLTRDIMQARKIVDATHIIHLMPQSGTALVGTRFQNTHRYRFTDQSVAIDGMALPVATLCAAVPVENQPGWTDLPLTGRDLPTFSDMASFLSWYDFYPGKQRFEICDGQVSLIEASRAEIQAVAAFTCAIKGRLPNGLRAIPHQLVRIGPISALKCAIAIGSNVSDESTFLDAQVTVLIRDQSADPTKQKRNHDLLRTAGVDVVIYDPRERTFADVAGKTISQITVDGSRVVLPEI